MNPDDSGDSSGRAIGEGWSYVSTGITFAVAIALFAFGGIWIDRRLGTMPAATLVLTFVGMGLAGYWLYQKVGGGQVKGSGKK